MGWGLGWGLGDEGRKGLKLLKWGFWESSGWSFMKVWRVESILMRSSEVREASGFMIEMLEIDFLLYMQVCSYL